MQKKIIFSIIALSMLIAGGIGTVWFWQKQEKMLKQEDLTNLATSLELKVGIAAMITPSEGKGYYGDLAGWLAAKTGKELKLVFKKNYQEMNDAIEAGEVDVAFICAGPYVEGEKKFGLELLAAPVVNGKTTYNSYIIAATDGSIEKFEDLKGKKFAFTDSQSNTGKLVPTYMIARMGETPETFFSNFIYSGSHDASINAVANKLVDGAAVDSLIYDYLKKRKPGLIAGTKIVEISPSFGIPMVVVRPGLKEDLKSALRGSLFSAENDPQMKDVLANMNIEKFTDIDDGAYDSIREMVNFIDEKTAETIK